MSEKKKDKELRKSEKKNTLTLSSDKRLRDSRRSEKDDDQLTKKASVRGALRTLRTKRKNVPDFEPTRRPVAFQNLDLTLHYDGLGTMKSPVLLATLHPSQPWLNTLHENLDFVIWDYEQREVIFHKALSRFANSGQLGEKLKPQALYFIDNMVHSYQVVLFCNPSAPCPTAKVPALPLCP